MNSFECKHCSAVYGNVSSFKTHLRRKHGPQAAASAFLDDDAEVLSCQICDFKSNNLNTHIVKTHNMTCEEYRNKFPGSQTSQLTFSQIQKMSQTKLENGKDTAHRKKLNERESRSKQFDDDLKCLLCEFSSKFSLISHITRKHDMTMEEYRTKFPNCTVQRSSKEQRENNRHAMQEKLADPTELQKFLDWRSFPSEIKHWTRKGFSEDEAETFVSDFQKNAALAQNNYPEMIQQKSEDNSGNKNPMSIESIMKRHGVSRQEATQMTPCFGRKGDSHPFFGKKHTEESLEKIANAPHLKNPKWRSKGEIEVAEFCKTLSNDVIENLYIKRYNADVVFPQCKLIVEFFGTMWHMDPRKYKEDDVQPMTKVLASESWERDKKKLEILKELGYDVLVIWESDWKSSKEQEKEKIRNAYNRTLQCN
jgi:predicted transcriptional regulator/very-short-patch-repair endonuclease